MRTIFPTDEFFKKKSQGEYRQLGSHVQALKWGSRKSYVRGSIMGSRQERKHHNWETEGERESFPGEPGQGSSRKVSILTDRMMG